LNKIVAFLGVVVLLMVISLGVLAQPTNLTDRELLIQLITKIEFIERSVKRIETHSEDVKHNMVVIEKQVSKNEINIAGFCNRLDSLMVRWNALLGLFAVFILGIFVYMWRTAYSVKNSRVVKGSE